MSKENVEIVKSVHPLSGTNLSTLFGEDGEGLGRFRALASLLTPDFVAVGGDLGGGFGLSTGGHGIEGLVAAWREWLGPWESYWTEVEDFIDAGEDRVLVLVRDHGRLRGSDSEVDNVGASVWTLRAGKIARIEFHSDRAKALQAVGLAG
jgi:ketosteroid isomerase-like protein